MECVWNVILISQFRRVHVLQQHTCGAGGASLVDDDSDPGFGGGRGLVPSPGGIESYNNNNSDKTF